MKRRDLLAALASAPAWPCSAQAQATPVLGILSSRSRGESAGLIRSLLAGLAEQGLEEGRNVRLTYRWAEGQLQRLQPLAEELAREPVGAIVAAGGASTALALKRATSSVPIVFVIGVDPVALELVSSLGRPGGNVTGATMISADFAPKRLELLRELAPRAGRLAIVTNPNTPEGRVQEAEALRAAKQAGIVLTPLRATDEKGLEDAFRAAKEAGVDAVLLGSDPIFNIHRNKIVALAAALARPVIYQFREYVDAGGLMSYGASIGDAYQQAGRYAARLLAGEKPADLPVLQPTRFELVINLKTAQSLGLAVPPTLLAGADEVIE